MEKTSATPIEKRLAIVTGENRGIGFEICRQLALNRIKVILTALNKSGGQEALKKLELSGLHDLIFHQLDVKDPTSVASLAKFIQTNFQKLDILEKVELLSMIKNLEPSKMEQDLMEVNDENAHLLTEAIEQPYGLGEECLKTNYYGTKAVTQALLPLLQLSTSARVVNVSSNYGELRWIHNENVKAELQNIDNLTEERIGEIIQCFLNDLKAGDLQDNGWPLTVAAYKVSKAAINAYTRLIAKNFPNILVNCVHPGYVITDITSNTEHLTPEKGARAPVMVALLPKDGPSGVYFHQMQVSSFVA